MCGVSACHNKFETYRGFTGGVAHDCLMHNPQDFPASLTGRLDKEKGTYGETTLPLLFDDPGYDESEPKSKRRRTE